MAKRAGRGLAAKHGDEGGSRAGRAGLAAREATLSTAELDLKTSTAGWFLEHQDSSRGRPTVSSRPAVAAAQVAAVSDRDADSAASGPRVSTIAEAMSVGRPRRQPARPASARSLPETAPPLHARRRSESHGRRSGNGALAVVYEAVVAVQSRSARASRIPAETRSRKSHEACHAPAALPAARAGFSLQHAPLERWRKPTLIVSSGAPRLGPSKGARNGVPVGTR